MASWKLARASGQVRTARRDKQDYGDTASIGSGITLSGTLMGNPAMAAAGGLTTLYGVVQGMRAAGRQIDAQKQSVKALQAMRSQPAAQPSTTKPVANGGLALARGFRNAQVQAAAQAARRARAMTK